MDENGSVGVFYGLSYYSGEMTLHIFEPRRTVGFAVHFNNKETLLRKRKFAITSGRNIDYLERRKYCYGIMSRERFDQIASAVNGYNRFIPESELNLPKAFFKEDVPRFLDEIEGMNKENGPDGI